MKRLIVLLSLLALGMALSACTRDPSRLKGRVATALTPPVVVADWIIAGRNDFMLLDLRSQADFDAGHLPDAVQITPAKLQESGMVRALPTYKKLVLYDAAGEIEAETLYPLLEEGHHVLVLQGGYAAWQREVLTEPAVVEGPAEAKRRAVAQYLRGESTLGTPEPLGEIKAEEYLRPPALPAPAAAPTFADEGC